MGAAVDSTLAPEGACPNRLKQAEVRLLGQLDRQGVTHGQGPEREVEWPTSVFAGVKGPEP